MNGIELLHLNNVVTGCILLGGLFFYDIFWVFGTNVMVTVAKSFEAPIKREAVFFIHTHAGIFGYSLENANTFKSSRRSCAWENFILFL